MSDNLPIEKMDREALIRHMEEIHTSLRKIIHDMSNPLGILRMAVYFLQTAKPEQEKREEYYVALNQSLDKIDGYVGQLREVTEKATGQSDAQGGER